MRRLLALLFCALLLCAPAGAETFAVNAGENALLVTDAGKTLTAWGEYAAASRVSPPECPPERALFIAAPVLSALPEGMEEGDLARYRLLNARGEALGDELYSSARHLPEAGVVVVWQGEWTGVIGEDGEKILPCACGGVLPDGEGGFLVTPREYFNCDADGYAISARLWRIDPDGAAADTGLTVQPQFSAEFADGLAPCASPRRRDGATATQTRGANWLSPAAFDYAEDFRDGYAAARTLSGGMGLLRPDGSWALEPVYSELGYLWGDGAAFYALREGSVELIDRRNAPCARRFRRFPRGLRLRLRAGRRGHRHRRRRGNAGRGHGGERPFPRRCGGGDVSANFTVREGAPDRLIFTRGMWPEQEAFLADLRLRRVAGPYRAIESGLWWKGDEGRFLVCDFELSEQTYDGETYAYPIASSYVYGIIDEDGAEVLPVAYSAIQYLSTERYWVAPRRDVDDDRRGGERLFEVSEYMDLMD